MKRTNIEFMIGWLDALRRDDLDALQTTLDADITWHGLRKDLACHGPDEVVQVFAYQRDAYPEVDTLELIGGERHAIMHTSGATLREVAGIPVPEGIYNLFTIDNDKVLRIDDFTDRTRAFDAANLSDD
jgi:hypothetical protein